MDDSIYWNKFLDKLSYKDNYSFWAEQIESEVIVTITVFLTDFITRERNMLSSSVTTSWIDEESAISLIHDMLYKIEIHEMYEWFCIDNKHVIDPHPKNSEMVTRKQLM